MTPRQARIALVTFVLIAAGVVYNALYMQDEDAAGRVAGGAGASQDPRAETPAGRPRAGKATKHVAMLRTDLVTAPGPATPSKAADADTVRAIQRELQQRGLGPVASDGIMHPTTRAAIMSYEHDHRLPLTGEATEALLKHLLLGAPAAPAPAAPGEGRSMHAEALIREVQRMLTAGGYRPGPVDGRIGSETTAAIRAFEQDQGLAPKGRVSAEVVAKLLSRATRQRSAAAR